MVNMKFLFLCDLILITFKLISNTEVSDYDICSINIPSGIPFVYEFDDDMNVVSSRHFLGDQRRIDEGIARAASIGAR